MSYAGNIMDFANFSKLSKYEQYKCLGIDLLLWLNKTPLENYKNSRFL